jgi:hypothetical protein
VRTISGICVGITLAKQAGMRTSHLGFVLVALAACGDTSSKSSPDAQVDGPSCVAETDAQLCARINACEAVNVPDNCGAVRSVDCGACGGSNVCVQNQCQASQCSSFAFPNMSLATTINADGVQDALAAVSSDGMTVINQRRNCATSFTTLLIDNLGINTTTIDLGASAAFSSTSLHTAERAFAMTGDGLTVVGANPTRTGFVASTRPAKGSSAFPLATNSLFTAITVTAPAILIDPAISPDGLRFYYSILSSPNTAQNGIYEAVRASTAVAFPAGVKMGGDVQQFDAVNGVTADGMTLFVQKGFAVSALTRRSLKQQFTNPNAPAAAPVLPGFRTRPFGDCAMLLGTCTSGCNNEQSCVFTH